MSFFKWAPIKSDYFHTEKFILVVYLQHCFKSTQMKTKHSCKLCEPPSVTFWIPALNFFSPQTCPTACSAFQKWDEHAASVRATIAVKRKQTWTLRAEKTPDRLWIDVLTGAPAMITSVCGIFVWTWPGYDTCRGGGFPLFLHKHGKIEIHTLLLSCKYSLSQRRYLVPG